MQNHEEIIGVKELRQNLEQYIAQIAKGKSFMVIRRSKPVFNITPVNAEENWEEAIDFTKIKKGGVKIEEILLRL
jgi:antitoxin (DNA-binding transcriptional repressor) of toxin-antitoxin stability system